MKHAMKHLIIKPLDLLNTIPELEQMHLLTTCSVSEQVLTK